MNMFDNLDNMADRKHYILPDLVRILLGVVIFLKGWYFISHTQELQHTISASRFPWLSFAIAHYVAMISLTAGVLIAIGCLTRLACALQIPILLGAVLFVNWDRGVITQNPELALSIVVLALLIFYFFYGSGYLSADHNWRTSGPDWRASGPGRKNLGT